MTYIVKGAGLTIEDVVNVARNNEKVELHPDSIKRINKCRAMLERKIEANQSETEFFERDQKDLKTKGLQKVLDTAELQINNFETKEELQKEIDTVMQFVI